MYAAGTVEDPGGGAHRKLLSEIVDVAEEVVRFDTDADSTAAARWLTSTSGPQHAYEVSERCE